MDKCAAEDERADFKDNTVKSIRTLHIMNFPENKLNARWILIGTCMFR